MEEKIYYWVGLIAIWSGIVYLTIKITCLILISLINCMGDKFDKMWFFMEFIYYRKKFKEWVKDKERHPRMKKNNLSD
jgi:hypothetical protein